MSAIDVFREGTPEGAGEAVAAARAALASGRAIRWHVDPANLGLLSRFWQDASVVAVLAAVDEAPDRTIVAHEGALVPTLRRLHERGLPLRLSTGRPYVLPPPALDISTNDLCGLACVMCNNRASRRDPRAMTPADVRALLAEAAAWGIRRVALTGAGEPFRDPEMLGYIRDANALGLLVTLTTNGFPVSEAVAAELAGRVVSVSVSIHGATPDAHDAIVGVPKAGENAFRAVRRLVAARDAGLSQMGGLRLGAPVAFPSQASGTRPNLPPPHTPPSKLSVNVSAVIQRANVDQIAALALWAREAGCDGFNVQPVNLQHGLIQGDHIVRRDDLAKMASLWPTREDAVALDRMIEDLVAIGRQSPRFLHATEERLALLRRYFDDPSRAALGVSCRVGEAFLAVDHRGAIKPCYRLSWPHRDARLVDLRALWSSEAYASTRGLIDACPLTCLNNCYFRAAKKDDHGHRDPG